MSNSNWRSEVSTNQWWFDSQRVSEVKAVGAHCACESIEREKACSILWWQELLVISCDFFLLRDLCFFSQSRQYIYLRGCLWHHEKADVRLRKTTVLMRFLNCSSLQSTLSNSSTRALQEPLFKQENCWTSRQTNSLYSYLCCTLQFQSSSLLRSLNDNICRRRRRLCFFAVGLSQLENIIIFSSESSSLFVKYRLLFCVFQPRRHTQDVNQENLLL